MSFAHHRNLSGDNQEGPTIRKKSKSAERQKSRVDSGLQQQNRDKEM